MTELLLDFLQSVALLALWCQVNLGKRGKGER